MDDNGFIFGKKATWDFPILKVEKYPDIPAPVKRFEAVSIPGRNGNVHIFEGSFDNITKSYECYFHADDFVSATAHEVKAWLVAPQGYQRLIDLYDPDCFYRASVLEAIKIENWMNQYARFTVNFTCDPRAFLISGDNQIPVDTSGIVLRSPCDFPALPLITIHGTGDGTISVGGTTVQLFSMVDTVTLDCELQDAYRDRGGILENWNNKIYAPEFPVLQPGENEISWSGGVERVEIIPRWWTL